MLQLERDDISRMNNLHEIVKNHYPWFDDFVEEQKTETEFIIQKYWADKVDLIDKNVSILNSGIGFYSVPFCYQKGAESVWLYDMDPTVEDLSYQINSRYHNRNFMHNIKNITFEYEMLRTNDPELGTKSDVIINTSCEHSYPMDAALTRRARGKMCVMSGNNLTKRGHINLINSMDQLKEQCQLSTVLNEDVIDFKYVDDLGERTYQQFFLIGIK